MTNTPLDEFQAQFDRHAERLSDVEKEHLRTVLETYRQRLLEPQWRERHPGFSLAVVLRDLPYEPSDQLTAVIELLDVWLAQPRLDSLIESLIDQICGE